MSSLGMGGVGLALQKLEPQQREVRECVGKWGLLMTKRGLKHFFCCKPAQTEHKSDDKTPAPVKKNGVVSHVKFVFLY